MKNKSSELIVFIHVPKTAGNTLMTAFSQNYLFNKITTHYPSLADATIEQSIETWVNSHQENILKSDMLFGHFAYGIHEFFPEKRNIRYATMLRHPVARTISFYYFAQRYPSHYLHKEANAMSLLDFINADFLYGELTNGQTRLLAGYQAINSTVCSEEDYQLAVAHLNSMRAVGIQEKFDESLLVFKQKLGLSNCFYTPKNVARKKNSIDDAVRERIIELNQFDMKLYDMSLNRMSKDILEIEDFEKSLRTMRKWNRVVGKIGAPFMDIFCRLAVRN